MNKKEYMRQYRLRNKERLQKYQKDWRNKNRDKVREQSNRHYQKHKGKILRRHKKWEQENSEHLKEYRRRYYQKNKEEIRTRRKKYRLENKSKVSEYGKSYYQKNKETFREYNKDNYKKYRQGWKETIKGWGYNLTCPRCGLDGDLYFPAMDFHHRDPSEKSFLISSMLSKPPNEERIKLMSEELKKCDILCASCHRIKQYC